MTKNTKPGAAMAITRGASSHHQLEAALSAWCIDEPAICSEQRDIEALCEGDVGGVVDRHVLAQFPAAIQKGAVGHSLDPEIVEVDDSGFRPFGRQCPGGTQATEGRDDFEVQQFGCRKAFTG